MPYKAMKVHYGEFYSICSAGLRNYLSLLTHRWSRVTCKNCLRRKT